MKTIKKLWAILTSEFLPGYSHCKICGFSWNFVKPKIVHISSGVGCWVTCDKCWDEASINELVFLHRHWYRWRITNYTVEHLLKCIKAEKENNPIFMRVET